MSYSGLEPISERDESRCGPPHIQDIVSFLGFAMVVKHRLCMEYIVSSCLADL